MLMEDYEIKKLGFSDSEIDAIREHFFMSLSLGDWELISFIDEEEAHEDGDEFLKLPTGRWVYFDNELLHKDKLSQID